MKTGHRSQLVQKELEGLRDKEGVINARSAVEWARRRPNSALYSYLEWDDAVAAEEHRVDQVRNLIQIHLVDPLGGRRYVSLSIDRTAGGGYRPTTQVMRREDLRKVMLGDALDDLERLERLYRSLAELRPVWAVLEKLRGR